MATTEITGAEEVAWDLSDLFQGIDDPRIDADVDQAEADAAAFRERYHGKVAELGAAELAEAVAEHERIESAVVRPLTYAHLVFATNMADPARGALVARLGEKAAALETQLLFFALEWAAAPDDVAEKRPRRPGARRLAPSPPLAPQVPAVPPLRARGADRHREDRLRRVGVVAALRGAARRAPRRARRRGAVARDGDGAAVRPRPRHAPRGRRGDHRGARPGAADADVRVQHDPPGQGDRRPPARLPDLDLVPQPRERDDRRGRRRARRGDDLPLRRRPAVLPAQGAAARARPPRALRPLRARLDGHGEGPLGGRAADRRRRVHRVLGRGRRASSRASSTTAGSTGRSGRTSGRARSARRPSRASTRTCS